MPLWPQGPAEGKAVTLWKQSRTEALKTGKQGWETGNKKGRSAGDRLSLLGHV